MLVRERRIEDGLAVPVQLQVLEPDHLDAGRTGDLADGGLVVQGASCTPLSGRTPVPIFILVPQVTMRKRLDVDGAARKWLRALPQLVLRAWPR